MSRNPESWITAIRDQLSRRLMAWYEKIDLNSNEWNYRVLRTINMLQVQSNISLVHAGFEIN